MARPRATPTAGGIWIAPVGTVVLRHSAVSRNRSAVSAPNGHFSNGGATTDNESLMTEDSSFDRNSSIAETDVPSVHL
jgi:hypothetical protein